MLIGRDDIISIDIITLGTCFSMFVYIYACFHIEGSYKKLQPFFKDFSRTTLDFQGQPTRNIISQIVQKCIFPVYSNKTLRL